MRLLLIPLAIALATMAVLLIRHYWIRAQEAKREGDYWWLASRGAALVTLVFVSLSLWYFGNQWWNGSPVDGDELLSLVNKRRTDPNVARAFRRLGYSNLSETSEGKERTDWMQHGVSFWVNSQGNVTSIAIGDAQGRFFGNTGKPMHYAGEYPFGLLANDDASEVRKKLGPPDDWEKKQSERPTYWIYSKRKIAVSFHEQKMFEVLAFAGD